MLPLRRLSIVALRDPAPTSGVAAMRLQWRQPQPLAKAEMISRSKVCRASGEEQHWQLISELSHGANGAVNRRL
jgi:hypothetical protein